MRFSISQYLLLSFVNFTLVGLLTPVMRKVAFRVNALDAPDAPRKIQIAPVPYLGGVAIVVGVLATTYGSIFFKSSKDLGLASTVLLPAALMAAMGLADDLRSLQPWPRLLAQTCVGLVVAAVLIATDTLGTPTHIFLIDALLTTTWIVGVCNSINFFDNLDGGAAGTVAVISIFTFLIAIDRGQEIIAALAVVTAGATLGFLIWNRSPAKIYMGDAGALFLGIIVAVMTIRLKPDLHPLWKSLTVPLFLLAVPLLDTTVAVFSRLQRNISPFTGGRDHLSHRLMRKGIDRKVAAITLWSLAGIFGVIAYAVYLTSNSGWILSGALLWLSLYIFFIRIPHQDL